MAKNQINVEVSDNKQTQIVSLVGDVTIKEVVGRILSLADTPDEATIINRFLEKTGALLVVETPDSSWVVQVQFDAQNQEITFVAGDGAPISFPTTFEKFLEDLKAPSFGKLQWQYRRGLR